MSNSIDLWKIGGLVAWQLLELWLGKTNKVDAASTPELIFNFVKKLFEKKEIPK